MIAERVQQIITGRDLGRPTPEVNGASPLFFPEAKKFFVDGINGSSSQDLANACFQKAVLKGEVVRVRIPMLLHNESWGLVNMTLEYVACKVAENGNVGHIFLEKLSDGNHKTHLLDNFDFWEKIEVPKATES